MRKMLFAALGALTLVACSSSATDDVATTSSTGGMTMTDAQYQAAAVSGMHDALLIDLGKLVDASMALQAAAPTPDNRGWDATLDADAISQMKTSWTQARTAYERIEGALAPIFPNIDNSIDARYDDFMTELATTGGDNDLFDDTGVTGLHAVERILYSNTTPASVVTFEAALPGYVPSAFPATAAQAVEFKTKLCAKLIADAQTLKAQWTPANIDVAIAFQGLISLMNEQREKVQKASSDEEESRYSQRTMADLRDNLAGTKTIYALFEPWILSKPKSSDPTKDGKTIDATILKGFGDLDAAYALVPTDAIPQPPATWSAEDPSPADLLTPFGVLYQSVETAVDPAMDGSVVSQMNDAAVILGFPQFQAGK